MSLRSDAHRYIYIEEEEEEQVAEDWKYMYISESLCVHCGTTNDARNCHHTFELMPHYTHLSFTFPCHTSLHFATAFVEHYRNYRCRHQKHVRELFLNCISLFWAFSRDVNKFISVKNIFGLLAKFRFIHFNKTRIFLETPSVGRFRFRNTM